MEGPLKKSATVSSQQRLKTITDSRQGVREHANRIRYVKSQPPRGRNAFLRDIFIRIAYFCDYCSVAICIAFRVVRLFSFDCCLLMYYVIELLKYVKVNIIIGTSRCNSNWI